MNTLFVSVSLKGNGGDDKDDSIDVGDDDGDDDDDGVYIGVCGWGAAGGTHVCVC